MADKHNRGDGFALMAGKAKSTGILPKELAAMHTPVEIVILTYHHLPELNVFNGTRLGIRRRR